MDITRVSFTINGRTYVANDIEDITPDKRRLILTIIQRASDRETLAEMKQSNDFITSRYLAVKFIFTHTFSDVAEIKETQHVGPDATDWQFVILDVQDKHIKWAHAAKECGLIDRYIADYDTGRSS